MDGLGAQTVSNKFAVVGTGSEGLLALCESLYTPDLEAGALVGLAEHCFNQAMQRDVSSGCDVRVLTVTNGAIYQKDVVKMDT
jgi:20S proteasome alpha/beta subunit